MVVLSLLLLTLLWSSPPVVHVTGKVTITACPGNPPRDRPSQCSTVPVAGATVILAPIHGQVMTATTVSDGEYRLEVTPGLYIVAAMESEPIRFSTQPSWVSIPAQPVLNMNIAATYLPI